MSAPTPFGIALRGVRQRRRLSQSKLSEMLDCDHSYISRLEVGSRFPSREFVERLIAALRIPSDEAAILLSSGGWVPITSAGRAISDPLLVELGELLWDDQLPRETFAQLRGTLTFLVDAARLSLPAEVQP